MEINVIRIETNEIIATVIGVKKKGYEGWFIPMPSCNSRMEVIVIDDCTYLDEFDYSLYVANWDV